MIFSLKLKNLLNNIIDKYSSMVECKIVAFKAVGSSPIIYP